MPYLNLDPNYFDHPKTRRLVSLLGAMSDVLPLRLWAYCAKYHPVDGTMKGYTPQEFEGLIGWPGAPGAALAALIRVGYVREDENGYACVDWAQHEGHLAAFSKRAKEAATARWSKYASSIPEAMLKDETSNTPTLPYLPNQPTIPTKQNEETPSPLDSEPPVLVFPCNGKVKEWGLQASKVAEYVESFPGVDVMREVRAARQWLLDNPARRKTATGMARFLGSWMARQQNRGGTIAKPQSRIVGGATPVPGKYANLGK